MKRRPYTIFCGDKCITVGTKADILTAISALLSRKNKGLPIIVAPRAFVEKPSHVTWTYEDVPKEAAPPRAKRKKKQSAATKEAAAAKQEANPSKRKPADARKTNANIAKRKTATADGSAQPIATPKKKHGGASCRLRATDKQKSALIAQLKKEYPASTDDIAGLVASVDRKAGHFSFKHYKSRITAFSRGLGVGANVAIRAFRTRPTLMGFSCATITKNTVELCQHLSKYFPVTVAAEMLAIWSEPIARNLEQMKRRSSEFMERFDDATDLASAFPWLLWRPSDNTASAKNLLTLHGFDVRENIGRVAGYSPKLLEARMNFLKQEQLLSIGAISVSNAAFERRHGIDRDTLINRYGTP